MKLYKLLINPEDNESDPLTWDKLMDWLSHTGYVEGRVSKIISPLDRPYLEDYIGECWLLILEVPKDKMLGIWHKGKGKFVNYIKSIILNNTRSTTSPLYNNVRKCRQGDIYLDDAQWDHLRDNGNVNVDIYFPQANRDSYNDRVKFETETITVTSENKLFENADKEI